MRTTSKLIAIGAALLIASGAPAATPAPPPPPPTGYVMPDTDAWDFAAADGSAYRIFVSRPSGPPPAGGYPVLYVLDGNAMFAGFAESRRIQEWMKKDAKPGENIGKSIIVAIGYPTDDPYDPPRRLYDFTPPAPARLPAAQAALKDYRTGGQDRFAAFLLDRLRPEIARRYAVDPARQSLFGHSLGGLFALHMLYTHPDAFAAIIAASPSQWWNDQLILAEERAFTARLVAGRIAQPVSRLLLVAGAREEVVANVWDAATLAQRLAPLSAYGLRTRHEEFADEVHITVPSRAVTTTLRFAFAWR